MRVGRASWQRPAVVADGQNSPMVARRRRETTATGGHA